MSYQYREFMTNEMKKLCDEFYNQDRLKEEFLFYHKELLKVNKILDEIKLPMKNEN